MTVYKLMSAELLVLAIIFNTHLSWLSLNTDYSLTPYDAKKGTIFKMQMEPLCNCLPELFCHQYNQTTYTVLPGPPGLFWLFGGLRQCPHSNSKAIAASPLDNTLHYEDCTLGTVAPAKITILSIAHVDKKRTFSLTSNNFVLASSVPIGEDLPTMRQLWGIKCPPWIAHQRKPEILSQSFKTP